MIQTEAGKIAVQPKYANHTEIHTLEKNREHKGAYPYVTENAIVHLKKAHPVCEESSLPFSKAIV